MTFINPYCITLNHTPTIDTVEHYGSLDQGGQVKTRGLGKETDLSEEVF